MKRQQDRNNRTSSKEALDKVTTDRKGFYGLFELLLRKFQGLLHLALMLPLYGLGSICLGIAITPAIIFFTWSQNFSQDWNLYIKYPWIGFSIAASYFIYGLSLITIIPVLNKILAGHLKEWRGPYYSAATFRWFLHNGFTYLVRFTFLEFTTPSPLNIFFFRQMGMKIGRAVQINSSHISDPSMIELGDKVTIGGSAVIVGHYGAGGYLVLAPTKIEKKATIGLRATIMGGVHIGEGAKVLPNSVVLPKTHIPSGEIWGGVPAQRIDPSDLNKIKKSAA